LREIEADPSAFMQKNGWVDLEFGEERNLNSMRKLYATLQVQILDLIGLLDALKESPDYELVVLKRTQPDIIKRVAADQIKAMTEEINSLREQAARLKEEIDNISSVSTSSSII
jgi:hypothetical protein